MDISREVLEFGNNWTLSVNSHFMEILEPLQAESNARFNTSVKVEKGVRYGDDGQHRLDIYSSTIPSQRVEKVPVIVYIHGGGFTMGDTDITQSMHGNIGYYFATHGCLGVLATYRLVPTASFPQGAEDIVSIVAWLVQNAHQWSGDPTRIYLLGQSAGGAHLATALFTGLLKNWNDHIGGIVLQSATLWYNLKSEMRRQTVQQYHRTDRLEEIQAEMSVSLFEKCTNEEVGGWPPLLLMLAEFDPDEIVDGNLLFVDSFRKKLKRLPVLEVVKGHNHISYMLGVGLPGNTVGARLLAFVHGK